MRGSLDGVGGDHPWVSRYGGNDFAAVGERSFIPHTMCLGCRRLHHCLRYPGHIIWSLRFASLIGTTVLLRGVWWQLSTRGGGVRAMNVKSFVSYKMLYKWSFIFPQPFATAYSTPCSWLPILLGMNAEPGWVWGVCWHQSILQFWHHLPGVSVRSHKFKGCAPQDCPYFKCQSQVPEAICTSDWLAFNSGVPTNLFSGLTIC